MKTEKTLCLVGQIVAILLILVGIFYPLPEKRIKVSGSSKALDYSWERNTGAEYVGGDCYNYQMEASLKAGYTGGLIIMKSVLSASGILLMFLSLYTKGKYDAMEEQTKILSLIAKHTAPKAEAAVETYLIKAEPAEEIIPPKAEPAEEKKEPATAGWKCPECGAHNAATAMFCKQCNAYAKKVAKPEVVPVVAKPAPVVTKKDSVGWTCSSCGARNASMNVYCSECDNHR